MKFADFNTPETFRNIQRDILLKRRHEYTSIGEHGQEEGRRDIEQKIRNIKDRDLRKVIEALPEFGEDDVAKGWSHFMALFAGRHLFPDANHRTGFTAFLGTTIFEWGLMVSLNEKDSGEMVKGSKVIRDEHRRKNGRYYLPAELADPSHPYRQHFAAFEPKLELQAEADLIKEIENEVKAFGPKIAKMPEGSTARAEAQALLDSAQKFLDSKTPEQIEDIRKGHGLAPRKSKWKQPK